jgi:hypothetical protein
MTKQELQFVKQNSSILSLFILFIEFLNEEADSVDKKKIE